MQSNWGNAFKMMLASEGGYVNHPSDPGGMTNLGVTKRVWEEWVGRESNEKEMRSLTPEMVEPLYKRKFWDACKCDDLPSGIDYLVFDFAVNAGVGRSAKILQTAVGATPDGGIGAKTVEKLNQITDGQRFKESYALAKIARYVEICNKNPVQVKFLKGWINRTLKGLA